MTTTDASPILALCSLLHRGLRPEERIEVRCFGPDKPNVVRFCRDAGEVARTAHQHAPSYNVYLGAVPRDVSGRGTADHCTSPRALWCEADFKTWADAADPRAAAEHAIATFALRFGASVYSGGGYHLYLPLAEAVDVREPAARARVECLNAWLGRALAGQGRASDHVQDIARILRVPATLNHKYAPARPVTLERCAPATRYTLDGVEQVLRAHYPWAEKAAFTPTHPAPRVWAIPDAPPRDLRERAAAGRIRRETLALLDSTGPDRYNSPSEADAALAAGLVSAGLTADEALALLLDSTRGEDAVRRKGERYAVAYWQRTVAHAAEFIGPVDVRVGGQRMRRITVPHHRAFEPVALTPREVLP